MDEIHPGRLYIFHRDIMDEYLKLKHGIEEDVPLWKSRKFRQRVDQLLELPRAEQDWPEVRGKELGLAGTAMCQKPRRDHPTLLRSTAEAA